MKVLLADRVVTGAADGAIYAPGAVAMDGQRIAWVGPAGAAPTAGERHPFPGSTLLPGLVNTHTHTPMWLYRGLTEDVPRGEWLAGRLRPLEARYTPADLVAGARAGCLELLLNGVTTIADRHGHMEQVVEAVLESGLRAVVGETLYDADAEARLAATHRLVGRLGTDPAHSRVWAGVAPHATDSCSVPLLRRARALADATGARLFLHVAQSQQEVAYVQARGFAGCADALAAAGLLAGDVVAAHCTYLEPVEADRLGRAGVSVAHCPSSNAKLEGRVAPVTRIRSAGATVGLGTDAACCGNGMDLFEEMKVAALLNKVAAADPAVWTVDEVFRMATLDGARVLGVDHLVGSIEPGKRADLVVLGDTDGRSAPRLAPWHRPVANLVYSARGSDVRAVFVDGEQLVGDGAPLRLDAAKLVADATRAARVRR